MNAWWNALSVFQQVLFVIGCATTVFFIIQIIMMLIGIGDNDSFDADTSVDTDAGDVINDEGFIGLSGLKLLSVRSILAFFCIGSWMTFTMCYLMAWWWALIIGVAAGFGAALLVAFFIQGIAKTQSSGNIDVANSIGKTGEVYLTIPAKRQGMGKVNVVFQEKYVELEAVTDSLAPIKTGAQIRVTGKVSEGTVVVEPFAPAAADTDVPLK